MDKKENTRVLVFVYVGYIMRYLYLLVVIPFYGRVLGVTEYGRVLAAMSLMNVI
ncbi:MAG: lipopolysaccharide biosynthesis protein, partial [Trinickia sp.]